MGRGFGRADTGAVLAVSSPSTVSCGHPAAHAAIPVVHYSNALAICLAFHGMTLSPCSLIAEGTL